MQRRRFGDRALVDHRQQPGVAPGVQRRARGLQHHAAPGFWRKGRLGARLPVAQGATRRAGDGQGPAEPLAVARPDSRLGGGVGLAKGRANGGFAGLAVETLGLGPRRLGHGRNVGQPLGQGAKIEPCSADNDRGAAPRCDLVQRYSRRPQPAPDRPAIGGVGDPEQMVRRPRFLLGGRPGAEHPKVGVELQGVGVDDLAALMLGQPQGQGRLAACGGAGDQDYFREAAQLIRSSPRKRGPRFFANGFLCLHRRQPTQWNPLYRLDR